MEKSERHVQDHSLVARPKKSLIESASLTTLNQKFLGYDTRVFRAFQGSTDPQSGAAKDCGQNRRSQGVGVSRQ